MTTNEMLTLTAILVGPILAVVVARVLERIKEVRARRMDIFRTLMRTRRAPVTADHVGALNLIEIEFADRPLVMQAWRALMQHFGAQQPRRPDEEVNLQTSEPERAKRNEHFFERLADERAALLAKLLHAIAKTLGHKAEQLEIFEGGYIPQGWVDVDEAQAIARQFVVDLYRGVRAVPVAAIGAPPPRPTPQPGQLGSPFPPPPAD